jgi:hypothetical protein
MELEGSEPCSEELIYAEEIKLYCCSICAEGIVDNMTILYQLLWEDFRVKIEPRTSQTRSGNASNSAAAFGVL